MNSKKKKSPGVPQGQHGVGENSALLCGIEEVAADPGAVLVVMLTFVPEA